METLPIEIIHYMIIIFMEGQTLLKLRLTNSKYNNILSIQEKIEMMRRAYYEKYYRGSKIYEGERYFKSSEMKKNWVVCNYCKSPCKWKNLERHLEKCQNTNNGKRSYICQKCRLPHYILERPKFTYNSGRHTKEFLWYVLKQKVVSIYDIYHKCPGWTYFFFSRDEHCPIDEWTDEYQCLTCIKKFLGYDINDHFFQCYKLTNPIEVCSHCKMAIPTLNMYDHTHSECQEVTKTCIYCNKEYRYNNKDDCDKHKYPCCVKKTDS